MSDIVDQLLIINSFGPFGRKDIAKKTIVEIETLRAERIEHIRTLQAQQRGMVKQGDAIRELRAEVELLRAEKVELLTNYQAMRKNRDDFCQAFYAIPADIRVTKTSGLANGKGIVVERIT